MQILRSFGAEWILQFFREAVRSASGVPGIGYIRFPHAGVRRRDPDRTVLPDTGSDGAPRRFSGPDCLLIRIVSSGRSGTRPYADRDFGGLRPSLPVSPLPMHPVQSRASAWGWGWPAGGGLLRPLTRTHLPAAGRRSVFPATVRALPFGDGPHRPCRRRQASLSFSEAKDNSVTQD